MKMRVFLTGVLLIFGLEAAALLLFAGWQTDHRQDAVQVNEAVRSVQEDWNHMERHDNQTDLDYVVLDAEGTILFRTRQDLSESINAAILHRDTILDIRDGRDLVGKLLVYNDSPQIFRERRRTVILFTGIAILVQGGMCAVYMLWLNHSVIEPFRQLKRFAQRVAGGNLDIPLGMDRQNLFGAFTESFDLMRTELKKARQAEAEANTSKKELVAKLSHDIKTPVASIKAASEVGAALTDQPRIRDNYQQIIRKADQIDTLITNLFTATLEELTQLAVTPEDIQSDELRELFENADYLHRAVIPTIPECIIYADKLRLQQVFDNLFANSYKYAHTQIALSVYRAGSRLVVEMEDYGGGVDREELPLLKEKYRRGSNAENVEGAGLGLYISDYFLREMAGELIVQNGERGLRVRVMIALSGKE